MLKFLPLVFGEAGVNGMEVQKLESVLNTQREL